MTKLVKNSRSYLPVVALLFAMFIWGGSFIGMKIALQTMTPMVLVFGRMLIAAIIFLPMWKLFKPAKIRREDWKWLIAMAFFEPCIYFIFEAWALQLTSASQAGMITAMLPLMVGVVAFFTLGERVSRRSWFGFFVAFVGVIYLSVMAKQDASAPNPLLGNFYELLAMGCAAFYTVLVKKLSNRYSALFITAVQAWVGVIFFLPLALWEGFPSSITFEAGSALFYLGAIVTLGAYGCYNYGISHIPAASASAYVNLIPVFTLVLAVSMLGEVLTAGQIIAVVIIGIGVLISQLPGRKKNKLIDQKNNLLQTEG